MSAETKVLLVESDPAEALRMAGVLQGEGWAVTAAADAVMAQTVARQLQPNVAVVAMRLPGGGGVRVLQRLRTSLTTALVPAVGLADTDATHHELTAAGAQVCLTRPARAEALTTAVRRAVTMTLSPAGAPAHAIAAPERLQAVRASGLLDSPYDPKLDLLTRMAAALLGTPTALLSVVDADRQFFKSAIGVDDPWRSARQTPMSHSFCQWAVASGDTFIVNDAHVHPLVRHNPAVRELGVAAYAGIPLHDARDQAIGSFCVVDSKPRSWSDAQIDVLRELAEVARAEITTLHAPAHSGAQLARGVAASLRILAHCSTALSPADRDAFVRLAEDQTNRLAGESGRWQMEQGNAFG